MRDGGGGRSQDKRKPNGEEAVFRDDVEVDDEVEREFEGKAEGSMVELEKKEWKKRQTSHRKRKSRK